MNTTLDFPSPFTSTTYRWDFARSAWKESAAPFPNAPGKAVVAARRLTGVLAVEMTRTVEGHRLSTTAEPPRPAVPGPRVSEKNPRENLQDPNGPSAL